MDRTDDFLIPPSTRWLTDPDAQSVCSAIAMGGHQVYFVGGCVRNALLAEPHSDIDLSTDALPQEVMALAARADLRAVPTGIDHGTITVIVNTTPFEVTTFRRDVATDGRRAVVAFSDNIKEDAQRRDFTMNALYATPTGQLVDPLNGLPDLRARRVRFIEEADTRIKEDYLRSLRFFRFSAWYGDSAEDFDKAALNAIASNLDGLQTLSAERVGHEMRKLLGAPDPAPALAGMRSTGVLHSILPGADDRWIAPVVHFEDILDLEPSWLCRLAALGGSDVGNRLRLSRAEAKEFTLLNEAAYGMVPLAEVAYRHGKSVAQNVVILRAALSETLLAGGQIDLITHAAAAVFPVVSADLINDFQGPALGMRLAELEQLWINSGFAMGKSDLLNHG